MIVLGIDPGLDGALAVLGGALQLVWIVDTPTLTVVGKGARREYDLWRMAEILRPYHGVSGDAHAFIENIHAMPGQGVRSMFSMGYGLGAWHALLAGLGIPYTTVTPQRWKKALMDGMGKEKDASVLTAKRLFPAAALHGPKGGALDGRADALLLAEYGRRVALSTPTMASGPINGGRQVHGPTP